MGFSIGGFLGSIASSIVSQIPIIGPAIGQIISPSRPPAPTGRQLILQQPLPTPQQFQPIAFRPGPFPFGSQAGPTVFQPAAAGALVPFVAGARGIIAALLGRASATIGTRISAARVLSLVRDLGIAAAAAALGLTALEVAQIIAAKPKRRRRGITASQLATTKATIRRVHSINDAIASVCPPARRRVHRHHPRHHRH